MKKIIRIFYLITASGSFMCANQIYNEFGGSWKPTIFIFFFLVAGACCIEYYKELN